MYSAIYQALAEDDRREGLFRDYPSDFFDLVIVDECHRGSAREDSSWRAILDHFKPAMQLGMTATPLLEARDEKRLLRLQRQLAAYKLLIIDELGYVPLSPTGAELLFEVFSQRYERGSTLVTSNLPFDVDIGVRFRAAHRRTARPADASRPYPGNELRQLQARPFQMPLTSGQVRTALWPSRSRMNAESKKAPDIGGLLADVTAALLIRPAAAQSLWR